MWGHIGYNINKLMKPASLATLAAPLDGRRELRPSETGPVTADHVREFERDGITCVRGALTPDQVEQLRRDVPPHHGG